MGEIVRLIAFSQKAKGIVAASVAWAFLLGGFGPGQALGAPPDDRRGTEDEARASIVGGEVGSIATQPWLAYIGFQGAVEEFSCGGTVVAPRLVLTAAHCVLTGTGRVGAASNFSVLTTVGDLREATPDRVSAVSRVLVFPDYDSLRGFNDAALLVLAAPVTAPPLPLATSADEALLAAGTPVAVAGWGLTQVSPPRLPALLRQAQSVVQDPSYCQRKLRRFLSVYNPGAQACVKSEGGQGASLCNGDSGGPGIAQRPDGTLVQIGIISMKGSLNCDPRAPQVLARVDQVSTWAPAWTAATETGAPAPAVMVPKLRVPPVTRPLAEKLAWLGLEVDLGNRFSRGRRHQIACRRINREKVKCGIQWVRRAHLYRGAITIYSALPREGFVYNYRYTIRRFNLDCWLTYAQPDRVCNPRIFKR